MPLAPRAVQFFLGRTAEQKSKKEGGLGGLKSKLLCFLVGSRSEIAVIERIAKQAIVGIFALLRLKIERFRFSLNKRNTKQKLFQILYSNETREVENGAKRNFTFPSECRIYARFILKEKNGGRKKLKKCIEKISVLVRRSEAEASGNAPTELPHYWSVKESSEPPRARRVRQSRFYSNKALFAQSATFAELRSAHNSAVSGKSENWRATSGWNRDRHCPVRLFYYFFEYKSKVPRALCIFLKK